MPDDGARWLSYKELAEARDISRPSAVRLAKRKRWSRRRGNDGTTRVAVPVGEDQPKRDDTGDNTGDATGEDTGGDTRDIARIINAFEAGLAAFYEQVEAERQRANWAELARDAARTELSAEKEARARVESIADAAGVRADRAEQARDRLQSELVGAQEALAGAKTRLREADAARVEFWSRSRFGRLRAVWRGKNR
jgi:hypothetical protein